MLGILGLWFLLLGSSWQQKDPLNDFCRRFGHQTAVIDEKLYVDGGLVDWNPISQNNENYTNTWLLYNDLTTNDSGVPSLYANLSKNSSIPDVNGGVLWADDVNKRFYLYGGNYDGIQPESSNLLSYDVIYNQWEEFGAPDMAINSVAYGAGVGISELGQGYMLGGWLSNASVPGWSGGPMATSTLIKYEMDGATWSNNTGPDDVPRAEGVMVYLPASGSGLLVYFGGITAPYFNETMIESPMDTIHVYDIASGRWYAQTATGDVPLARRRFCADAAWAPDQSSYNIYLYGGLGFGANATGFDDVYILSLPSFEWTSWWNGSAGQINPHNTLTCNVVNKGQMLVMGGTFPLSTGCDSPETWGIHNMDLGKQSSKIWTPYQLNTTSYVVPPEILAKIGGAPAGGATVTAPAAGFNNSDLSVYFTQRASVASRSPTRSVPFPTGRNTSKPLPTGAIAGIAIGGAIVFIALLMGFCYFFRRHRKSFVKPPSPPTPTMTNTQFGHQPHTPHSQYTPQEQYHEPRYQLAANSPPVELPDGEYPMHQVDANKSIYQVDENHFYNGQIQQQQDSPTVLSPYSTHSELSASHGNGNDYSGTQGSPAPSYASPGRIETGREGERNNQNQNQTSYSG